MIIELYGLLFAGTFSLLLTFLVLVNRGREPRLSEITTGIITSIMLMILGVSSFEIQAHGITYSSPFPQLFVGIGIIVAIFTSMLIIDFVRYLLEASRKRKIAGVNR